MHINSPTLKKNILLSFIFGTVALCFLTAYAKFYFFKEYTFYVETACNTTLETCFIRDCTADQCPPNQLESFAAYTIPASAFAQCESGSCASFCSAPATKDMCERVICDSKVDTCSTPE